MLSRRPLPPAAPSRSKPTMRLFAIAAAASAMLASTSAAAAVSLRDDPTRDGTRLVRVNQTLHEFADATGGYLAGHFDRDDVKVQAMCRWTHFDRLLVVI
jgi:hypothetical protein